MEVTTSTVFVSLASVLLALVLKWIFDRHRAHQFLKNHGIPGPKPHVVFGNLRDLNDDFMNVMDRWKKKYGNVYGYYVGELPMVVLHDPEMIKECFIKHSKVFLDRPSIFLDVEPVLSSVVGLKGEEWKSIRSILTPSFSTSKMKLMTNAVNESVKVLQSEIGNLADTGQLFDISMHAKALSLNVIAKTALALEVNCQRDFKNKLFVKVREAVEVTVDGIFLDLVIALPAFKRILEKLFWLTSGGETFQFIIDHVTNVLNVRRNNKEFRNVDVLQLMLQAQDESNTRLKKMIMNDNHVIMNGMAILGAGYETTATTLSFALYVLSTHPDVQEKLYKEVTDAGFTSEALSYDDCSSLKYLDMFISEVLRMYPPLPLFASRVCSEDITVLGQFFPKGCAVQVPIRNLHYDPDLWSNPEEFNPDRFAEENKKEIHSVAYVPFGVGPRICLGMRFAFLELKLAIASLVCKYKMLPGRETQKNIELQLRCVLLGPKGGLYVKVERRKK